ncbi:peptidylprolyl isomerase [Salinisphaera aquimarina]|uniref:Chaperone SurA n=1 Tax=Salinisphaera aquimarina TaxID=2094031 RepID=A0ABV7ET72_9GAMM
MKTLLTPFLAASTLPLVLMATAVSAQSTSAGAPSLSDFSLYSNTQSLAPQGPKTLDKIVAVVGEDVVLESELDTAVNRIRARAGRRVDQMPPNVLRSQILDQLIITKLQVQRAEERNIQVTDQEIDGGIGRIAQQNNMSMQQLAQAVGADAGMSMEQLRDQVRQELLVSKLRREEVMSKVVVTNDDVDRYLENQSLRSSDERQYHIRQILISLPDDADTASVEAARDRIEALRRQIVDGGASFADVAEAESQGQNAPDGGDLGWLDGSYMPEMFTQVVPAMQPGDVSAVFRGGSGFHLIQLEDVRGGDGLASGQKVMVEEVEASHILLKPNEIRDTQRTRDLARQIRERLDAGDDFAALAREYSDDNATANQGGELGWVQPARFDPATQRQISSLSKGEISPIFQTNEGYELLKVEGRREKDQTREAIRNQARRALGEQKSSEEGELWLRKLRDEAYVDIRLPNYQPTSGS